VRRLSGAGILARSSGDIRQAVSLPLVRKLTMRDSSLSEQSRQLLLNGLSPPIFIKAGTEFVVQGSRPSVCTVILSGWACRYSTLADGRRQMLALHMSGDFVDLHSFPLKVMDHSVGALTDCAVATVPHPYMGKITETDPHLTRLMWLLTLVDAAILRKWLLGSGQQSALEHAAHLICELFVRLRVVGLASEGREFELPISQQEFGDALGISAVHVSRTLAELRSRSLFTWRRGRAQILDGPGLERLAEFDSTYLSLNDEPR
jgi:CRP-like cAMP-binding protein